VIIGGGFIGAELASTAQARGLQTSIVSPVPLMQRGLGVLAPSASERARQAGVRVFDSHTIAHFAETRDAVEVHLAGDQCIVADHVVVAIGGVPNVEWLQGSGLELDNGLRCDVTLAASGRDEIVGVGDVVSWPHPAAVGGLLRLEHWTNATEQARAAAHRLVTGERRPFAPVPSFWTDQFDTRIHGIGLPGLADTVDIIEGDPSGRRFVAEYRLNGELVGAVAAGPATLLLPYRQTLANRMQASIGSNLLSLNGPPIRT
jgi:NADPH-dependent 2,4-dienoyl-CoA reductase/sulfur reductase-like enzyme